MSQARFQKFQREKAKREKRAAKLERKAERADEADDAGADGGSARPQEQVLAELAALHQAFDDGNVDFDDFEDRKSVLLAELNV